MGTTNNRGNAAYRSARRANIESVCKFMGWPRPRYISSSSSGYICRWSNHPFVRDFGIASSYRAVARIYSALNINCRLTSAGHLIVPFAQSKEVSDEDSNS